MYNATVYELTTSSNGSVRLGSVFAAEVDSKGRMLRSSALQCTGLEGTPAYHQYYLKAYPDSTLDISKDDLAGYKQVMSSTPKQKTAIRTSIESRENYHGRNIPDRRKARGFDTD